MNKNTRPGTIIDLSSPGTVEQKQRENRLSPTEPDQTPMAQRRRRRIAPPSRFKYVLSLIIVAALAAVGALMYAEFFGAPTSKASVRLDLDAPAEVLLGAPFELNARIENESNLDLNEASISLVLPPGITVIGSFDQQLVTQSIGTLKANEAKQHTFQLIALEGEKLTKEITGEFVYNTPNVSSQFREEEKAIINIGEPGLRFTVNYPDKILSGEEFNVDFIYTNASRDIFEDIYLELDYPDEFEYLEADPPPTESEDTWELGSIGLNDTGKITLLGRVYGKEGSFYSINGRLMARYQGRAFPISAKSASFAIAPSPLQVHAEVNRNPDYVASLDDSLNYQISYTNNTEVGLKDVIVKARLIGEMYDISTLKTDAFFESVNNTITWNASRVSDLRLVQPGESGTVDFSIDTKNAFPVRQLSDKNYTLRIVVTVESPTVPFFVASEKTSGITELETKIAGRMNVEASAYFRDADANILNSGPIPPKVNMPTQYTVHWKLSNYAVDTKDIEVRTNLQSGVSWTGQVSSNIPNALPTVNERTSEVVWRIDRMYANQGVVDKAPEAIFQIEALPSVLEEGSFMPLIGETRVVATDDFTGKTLSAEDDELTTELPDDPTINGKVEGKVVQ